MPKSLEEISNIPHADASDKEIDELISKLKTFKEDEFADLLHQCHNVIRNREKLDPAAAFDEIAKPKPRALWIVSAFRPSQTGTCVAAKESLLIRGAKSDSRVFQSVPTRLAQTDEIATDFRRGNRCSQRRAG